MQKIKSYILPIVVLLLLAGAGALIYFAPKQEKEEPKQEEEVVIKSIAGKVVSVNAEDSSFVLLQQRDEIEFNVKLGDKTDFIRLVFPFDINNPPAEATFTPERKRVTIKDLKVNSQVFVRSSTAIKNGEEIINPLEIQILP